MTYEQFITMLRSAALQEYDTLLPEAKPNDRRRVGAGMRKVLLKNIPRYVWKRNNAYKEWLKYTENQIRAGMKYVIQNGYTAHAYESEAVKALNGDYGQDVGSLLVVDMEAVWNDANEIINNDPSLNGVKLAADLIIRVRGEMVDALIARSEIEALKYGAYGVRVSQEQSHQVRHEFSEWSKSMLHKVSDNVEGLLNRMRSADAEFVDTLSDIFGNQIY